MKKIISLILALVMVMGLAVSASAASITINPNLPADSSSTGETYNAYKVFDATISGTNVAYTIAGDSQFYNTINGYTYNGTKIFTLSEINTTGVYNVQVDASFTGEDAAKDLATALKAVANTVTATNNTGKFEGLDTGYYLITSTLGSALVVDTLGDVTINTKNEYPSLTKVADKKTAAFGETVTYTVTVKVPETAVSAITVTDTMTNLTYVGVTEDSAEGVTASANGKVITFTISADTVKGNLGKDVVIKYTATVDANATTASNEAYLTYSSFTSTKVSTTVKNYKVDVFKYTGENKTGLAGAGFVLKNDAGKYYKLTEGIVSWVDSIDEASEYITAADTYAVTFNGLANGTYTLVEKTVPAGYNKANDTEVKVKDADVTGEAQIEVLNSTGSELPSTGGMGTTLFYVVGGLMVLAAVVLLVTKKRMSSAE